MGDLQNPSTTSGPGAAARNDVEVEVEAEAEKDADSDDAGWLASNENRRNATNVTTFVGIANYCIG